MTLPCSVVCPGSTGSSAAIACEGVRCALPPKGMSSENEPTVESKRSVRPRRDALLRLPAISRSVCGAEAVFSSPASTRTLVCLTAPFVSRKARERSATVCPRQCMTMRGFSVTTATR